MIPLEKHGFQRLRQEVELLKLEKLCAFGGLLTPKCRG
jgi:hypothetical protein